MACSAGITGADDRRDRRLGRVDRRHRYRRVVGSGVVGHRPAVVTGRDGDRDAVVVERLVTAASLAACGAQPDVLGVAERSDRATISGRCRRRDQAGERLRHATAVVVCRREMIARGKPIS